MNNVLVLSVGSVTNEHHSLSFFAVVASSTTGPKPDDLVLEGFKGQTTPTNDHQLSEASDSSQSITWDSDVDNNFDLPDLTPNASHVAIPEVTETTPIHSAKTTPTMDGVSRGSSMEGLLTVDEEISGSNYDDMDYVEDVVDFGGHVLTSPPTHSDLSCSVRSEGVRDVTPDKNNVVSPLSKSAGMYDLRQPSEEIEVRRVYTYILYTVSERELLVIKMLRAFKTGTLVHKHIQ